MYVILDLDRNVVISVTKSWVEDKSWQTMSKYHDSALMISFAYQC